ncbi:unnamed protein product [Blepharisma stoltei]|uniref:Uncharacterized protein n=1 Tax=Blepharisma stoltei TaxID=1481888 RepID=A0AAU9J0Z7_9CILI|nr:unnamed protein product [Blepharisma stoltei]
MEGIPEGFFICEEYRLYEESLGNFTQKFYALPSATTDYDLTGQILWPGAIALSNYFINHSECISGKEVIELGAGSGFCGLVASRFCSKIVFTDGIDVVVNLLEKNKQFSTCNAEVCKIDWDEENNLACLEEKHLPIKYSIIIGAECIYGIHSIEPLFRTVEKLLENDGRFILCYVVRARNVYEELLKISEAKGFARELLQNDKNIYIFSFTKN